MERTIAATTTVHATPRRARVVLVDDPGIVLTDTHTANERHDRRFHTVLSVNVGAGTTLHQEVEVQVGLPSRGAGSDTVVLPLRWHATGHEKLFPTFAGDLTAAPDPAGTQLTLRGTYAVPLGPLGRFGDGLTGGRIARASLADLLAQVAKRLDTEVVRRIDAAPYQPEPYPSGLDEHDSRPELFIG